MGYYLRSILKRKAYSNNNYLENKISCLNSWTSNDDNLSVFYVEDLNDESELDKIALNLIFSNERRRTVLYFLPIEDKCIENFSINLSDPCHTIFDCIHYNFVNVNLETALKLIQYCNKEIINNSLIKYNQANMVNALDSFGKDKVKELIKNYFSKVDNGKEKAYQLVTFINNSLYKKQVFIDWQEIETSFAH